MLCLELKKLNAHALDCPIGDVLGGTKKISHDLLHLNRDFLCMKQYGRGTGGSKKNKLKIL